MKIMHILFAGAFALASFYTHAETRILELTLEDCRQLVIQRNLEVQASKLGWKASDALYRGERQALWEPTLVLSADRESNERENNSEQFVSQGVEDFSERNDIYRIAIEQPLITGGQVQLGYTLRDLNNNLREQRELEGPERDYEAFLGLVFTQPLLKNAGPSVTTSMIRMAREESEVAFQEWRRQIMQSLGSAEAAYWDLKIAQRRVEYREASVEVAEKILEDNRARLDAGRGGEAEVQQAEAGLALRETQLLEARQNLDEASSRLKTFFAETIREGGFALRAVDEPDLTEVAESEPEIFETAMQVHPDMLLRKHRVEQERIRMNYAKNQTLPDVNLQATYGFNGLGESSSEAFDRVEEGDFVSWSVGVQVRVPLGGGRRVRSEYESAKFRAEQGELMMQSSEVALSNALSTSLRRVSNHHAQASNYRRVAELNQTLLDTELARLEAGQSDSRKVLDTEERLTEALESAASSLVRFVVAKIELELSAGVLLTNRDLDPMTRTLPERIGAEAPEPAAGTLPDEAAPDTGPGERPMQSRPVSR